MKIHEKRMRNGLKVLVSPKKSLESVGIVTGFGFGSVDVGSRFTGLAHYLEHMLFKGTAKRNWDEINEITRRYNIFYNAETDYETTMYEASVQKRYVDRAMELMSDMIKNPRFDRTEFRHELGPILHETAIRKEDPESILYDNMPRVLFEQTDLVKTPTESMIRNNISLRHIKVAYEKYYNPRNAVLSIYGGISAEEGFALARKYFSNFERPSAKPERKTITPNENPSVLMMKKHDIGRGEVGIAVGCGGISRANFHEYAVMNVIAGILNNRIYDQVREVHGLSYDPSVDYAAYGAFSYLLASAGAAPSKLPEIKGLMLEEFRKLSSGRISKREIDTVKRGLEIKYAMDSDDVLESAESIAEMDLMYGSGRLAGELPKIVRRLDVEDIRRLISKYISMRSYGTIVLGRA